MKSCDIISLHTNLNDSSFQLINKNFINNCKNFFLINTSRGECLKTSDLVDGIKTGKILGACLDVIENESKSFENLNTNSDFEYLKKSEKVVLTPHIAGWSIESKLKLAQVVLKKLKIYMENKKILILCTGNSCRSQIAEGYLKFLKNRANIKVLGLIIMK